MKISANNFKWLSGEEFNLSKFTILIGENSGGKSTITKLMLFLSQNLEFDCTKMAYLLNGPKVKLGSYSDVVRDHDTNNEISIKCTVEGAEYCNYYNFVNFNKLDLTEKENNEIKEALGNAYGENVEIEWKLPKDEKNGYALSVKISVNNYGHLTIRQKRISAAMRKFSADEQFVIEYSINGEHSKKVTANGKRSGLLFNIKSDKVIEEGGDKLFLIFGYFILSLQYLGHRFTTLDYINPLNSTPTRYINLPDAIARNDSGDFEAAAVQISGPKSGRALEKQIEITLREMGIADSFRLHRAGGMPFAEYLATVNDVESNAVDLGYGLGLQIGIIARVLTNSKRFNCLNILEQPEVHLHPKLQAKFIEAIVKNCGHSRFVIETHSEHILRKLQVILKNGEFGLSKDDISIYYFKRSKANRISYHGITEEGYIEPSFPAGFYDNALTLVKELAS